MVCAFIIATLIAACLVATMVTMLLITTFVVATMMTMRVMSTFVVATMMTMRVMSTLLVVTTSVPSPACIALCRLGRWRVPMAMEAAPRLVDYQWLPWTWGLGCPSRTTSYNTCLSNHPKHGKEPAACSLKVGQNLSSSQSKPRSQQPSEAMDLSWEELCLVVYQVSTNQHTNFPGLGAPFQVLLVVTTKHPGIKTNHEVLIRKRSKLSLPAMLRQRSKKSRDRPEVSPCSKELNGDLISYSSSCSQLEWLASKQIKC